MTAAHHLARALHWVSGAILILMMLVVLADIVTRAVFGATGGAVDVTFRGAVELVSYGLLLLVLFALPYSVNRGQVIVDLFTEGMNERLKVVLSAFYTLGFGLLGAGMAVRFFEAIGHAGDTQEVTQDLLIPLTYIYAIVFFATTMLAIRAVLVAIQELMELGERS